MALSEILQPFTWGHGGQKLTPEQIAARRAVEEALLARGVDTSPIGHWTEGLVRVGDAALGAYRRNRLDKAERQNAERSRMVGGELMSAVFGGGARNTFPSAPGGMGGQAPQPNAGMAPAAKFNGSQQEFVSMLMPAAIQASQRTGIDPRIIVAQAAQETGWGRSAPGNNYFGIKSHGQGGGQTFTTHEVINGQRVKMKDSFRQFASPEDSVAGYADFMLKNPRYGRMREAQGLDAQLAALGASGYATDPNYANSVGSIARGIQLPQMGSATPPAQAALESMAVGQSMPMPSPVERNPMSGNVDVAQAAPDMGQAFTDAMFDPYITPQVRKVAEALFEQQMRQQDPSYQLDTDYKRAQIEKMHREAAGGGENVYGTPIYGKDPQTGQTVLGVIGKDGSFKRLDTGGVVVTPGVTWQDMGTYRQGFDRSGAPATPQVAKENYQEAFDTGSGAADAKTAAEKRADLPKVEQQAGAMLSTIDNLLNHPGLSSAVGWQGNIPDWMVPGGTQMADFMSVLDQIGGQAFLQAFESLKGGGQITEVEGRKATEAISRLRRSLSETEFRKAANELRDVVQAGLDRARKSAGGGGGTSMRDKYGLD